MCLGLGKGPPVTAQIQRTGLHFVSKFTYQKWLTVRDNAILVPVIKFLWVNVLRNYYTAYWTHI